MVLDASAVLAYLFREPGTEIIEHNFGEAIMSAVSLADVLSRVAQDGNDVAALQSELENRLFEIVPFTGFDAAGTAALAVTTMPPGLTVGERAAVELARARGTDVWTADRAWEMLDLPVRVRVVR